MWLYPGKKAAGARGDSALSAIKRYDGGGACYHQSPRVSLLGFSVNKGPEPLAAYVTRSHTHTQFFGNVLDRSDPSVEIAG
jgi:hypothetical protein